MNGIKFKLFCACAFLGFAFSSCEEVNTFVEDVFVYEPRGTQVTIAQLKGYARDQVISEDIYVQGRVTSSDEAGNFARKLVFQDPSGAITLNIDMGSSNEVYPVGRKISVQCKGLMLADVGGVLQLGSSVSGEGIRKEVQPMDNRTTRSSVFNIGPGDNIPEATMELGMINPSTRAWEDQLVTINNVFFQTTLLPFANAGGSSEQLRTLYNSSGQSILLCTRDASTMAAMMLPVGKGSVRGIVSYPNGMAQIMVSSIDDISFSPPAVSLDDPSDVPSPLLISEYYASGGMYYIELYNSGIATLNLSDYSLATDTESNGDFSKKITLDSRSIAPGGIVLYRNSAAGAIAWSDTGSGWDPLRTNYSPIRLDALGLDGNSQVALVKGGNIVDILSTTNKYNWAGGKTLVRRPAITGHSKTSDYTRADAGWITRVAGYAYNLGYHRFFDTDPDMDVPLPQIARSILEVRALPLGVMDQNYTITGRVTSDRSAGNVAADMLFMQDNSNRGICIAFRQGQEHAYNPGDEITVQLYGTNLESRAGLLVAANAVVSRSNRTASANQMPDPVEASVSQLQNLQSMYVYIKDVQIQSADLAKTYGAGQIGAEDRFANAFYVSTLPGASFASTAVSQKSGIIKGIASIDNSATEKLLVMPRNSADLQSMTANRFIPITATPVDVATLRAMPAGVVSQNVRVTATVVSDFTGGNYMSQDVIFVQDAQHGFLLKLPAANTYLFGQSLIVVLKDATISTADNKFVVTPSLADYIVPVGAPDPSWQPSSIDGGILNNLFKLVEIPNLEVSEADRMKTFGGVISFNIKGSSTPVKVVSQPTAQWTGRYIPLAAGRIIGLITRNGADFELYPRYTSDLSGLPVNGTRNNGEKVVYFVPSTDPSADLFISEAVIGQVDANGNTVATVARNNCNAKFVELYNPTGSDLVLNNYRVLCIKYNNSPSRSTATPYQFPTGLVLNPGRTIVFKYVSNALGTGSASTKVNTNTLWPRGYTGDQSINANVGVVVSLTASPGVVLCSDTRDFDKTIANATSSFPCHDGNDILVIQKTTDGGTTWTEIDRLFSFKTANGTLSGGVSYPYLFSYMRKPGKLGLPGSITDVSDPAYSAVSSSRNANDFNSTQCDPLTDGAANWTQMPINFTDDLGVHVFSAVP